MGEGGACIHPVGSCPSDPADAPLGSLNAGGSDGADDAAGDGSGDSEEESDDATWNGDLKNGDVVYHDKAARCVSFSAANLMHAAGDIAGAAAIARRAPKGMLLKQLGAKINEKIKSWVARKPIAFGYDQNRDPNLVRFIGWLLAQEEGLFIVALQDERKVADHAIGVDCGARRIYNPARRGTLPLSIDSLSECVPGGRKLIGIKEARKSCASDHPRVMVVCGNRRGAVVCGRL